MKQLLLLFISFLFSISILWTQPIQTGLISDNISPGTDSANPQWLTVFNNKLYFSAENSTHGRELWVYDGTNDPTLVDDINSGSSSSNPSYLVILNNKLYFTATNTTYGEEIWVYDGTNPPTVLHEIVNGSTGGTPAYLTSIDSVIYFQADNGTDGFEFWKYNGISAPVMLENINTNASTGSSPQNFIKHNNIIYFQADSGANGIETWKYDGITTELAFENNPNGDGRFLSPTTYNDTLYFRTKTGNNISDDRLHYLDVNAVNVKTANNNNGAIFPSFITPFNNAIYFKGLEAGFNKGWELFKHTPSTNSTQIIKDIRTGSSSSSPNELTVFKNNLYFRANDGINGTELWRTDTNDHTALVYDYHTVSKPSSGNIDNETNWWFTEFNHKLYFSIEDGTHGKELWALCHMDTFNFIAATNTTYTSPHSLQIWDSSGVYGDTFTNVNGCDSILFTDLTVYCHDTLDIADVISCTSSYQTPSGKTITTNGIYLDTIQTNGRCDSVIKIEIAFNSTYYYHGHLQESFSGSSHTFTNGNIATQPGQYFDTVAAPYSCQQIYSVDLLKVDYDTLIRTVGLVTDLRAGNLDSDPINFVTINDTVYFITESTSEVWKYDGKNTPIKIINGLGTVYNITVFNNKLYVGSSSGLKEYTYATNYNNVTNYPISAKELIVLNGKLYFTNDQEDKLYEYDGVNTPIESPNVNLSSISNLFAFKNALIFQANNTNSTLGIELYSYDGSNAPSLIQDIYTTTNESSNPSNFYEFEDTLFFTAQKDSGDYELWKYDGSNPPVEYDIYAGNNGSNPTYFQEFEGRLLFSATDGIIGTELWQYKGGIVSNYIDINSSPSKGSDPKNLVVFEDSLYFIAINDIDVLGYNELMVYNTIDPPRVIHSFNPTSVIYGSDFSNAYNFNNKKVLFNLKDFTSNTGYELWQLCYADSIVVQTESCPGYLFNNQLITLSGTYYDTLVNQNGCDSFITLNLTILPNSFDTLTISQCDAYTLPSQSGQLNVNGTYYDTVPNAIGCDSFITIYYTNLNSTSTITIPHVCDSFQAPSGKFISTQGIYIDTISNAVGCDSLITIDIQSLDVSTYETIIIGNVCDSFQAASGKWIKYSGTQYDTITNTAGCDSIITYLASVFANQYSTLNITQCYSYTSPSGKNINSTGTYLDTISTANGYCDSILTIHAIIYQNTTNIITKNICIPFTSPTGKVFAATGTYYDTIPSNNGCDSLITFNLTRLQNTYDTIDVNTCTSYTTNNGAVLTQSGQYLDILINSIGCDSFLTINLSINNTSSIATVAACDSYTAPDGSTYTFSGTYQYTTTNNAGCTHTTTLHLTIDNLPPVSISASYTNNVHSLEAQPAGYSYQWIRCDSNNATIAGANSQSYSLSSPGLYNVWVMNGACVDSASCYRIILVLDIDEPNNQISISPNPTQESILIEQVALNSNLEVLIHTELGTLVWEGIPNARVQQITLPDVAGIYLVTLHDIDKGIKKIVKIIKK